MTYSGKVRLAATFYGTPNSSKARFASGLMTLLAEKSTLFPIKCCLNLPSFPLSLSSKLLMALFPCLILSLTPSSPYFSLSALFIIEATDF